MGFAGSVSAPSASIAQANRCREEQLCKGGHSASKSLHAGCCLPGDRNMRGNRSVDANVCEYDGSLRKFERHRFEDNMAQHARPHATRSFFVLTDGATASTSTRGSHCATIYNVRQREKIGTGVRETLDPRCYSA
ncbi:unnamed protein product [Pleuronectes platessa]|uniref:Uncharacterized protein n=1 Tax=Pleuronectes platessa TaxID=8262 RepID=A0A9N7VT50_PLEPL|nr:unnamed protein product [Pleuronectes platessa]